MTASRLDLSKLVPWPRDGDGSPYHDRAGPLGLLQAAHAAAVQILLRAEGHGSRTHGDPGRADISESGLLGRASPFTLVIATVKQQQSSRTIVVSTATSCAFVTVC